MIFTLTFTILVEGLIALGYCRRRKKPLRSILLTSLLANILTQSLLWAVVNIYFQYYLLTLLITEISIWMIESLALYYVRANGLTFREASVLSLGMNLSSIAFGWLLPV